MTQAMATQAATAAGVQAAPPLGGIAQQGRTNALLPQQLTP